MWRFGKLISFFALVGSLLFGATAVAAQTDDIWRVGARVNVTASDHESVSAAGAIVSVHGSVREALNVAGAEVEIEATAADMYVAGAIVSVKGEAKQNMNIAGARLSVDAIAGGELNAAGARVLIGPQTRVRGETQIAGADVVFAGSSDGPATIYGDTVRIDGRIAGDVLVRARQATIGKTAVIDGAIVFETFSEPAIEEGATLRGRQTVTLPSPEGIEGEQILTALGLVVLFGVGAGAVVGLILLIVARSFVERSIRAIRNQPGQTLLTGLGVLVLVPLLAFVLMVTIIGIPVGLLTLLAFPLAMMVATVLTAFALSDWLLNRGHATRSFGARFLLLVVGLLIITLAGIVPMLGFVTSLAVLLIGLGAFWRTMRERGSAPAAA